jgi:geranylgeranyl pyrophosphate synthase
MTGYLHPELSARRRLIEAHLEDLLTDCAGPEAGRVREAMRYAVLGGGQRFRPLLSLLVGDMLGAENARVLRAALSVELLHCASLIVDDLPCMDNEALRRGRASTHVAFGEPVALLAAFSLVALSARCVLNLPSSPRELPVLVEFQQDLLKVLDCDALVAGQAMDLALSGAPREESRARMNELKTAPLFLLAVRAGALFARLTPERRRALESFGRAFGLAFQTTDDYLDDELQDLGEVTRTIGRARDLLAPFADPGCGPHLLLDYLYARASEKDPCYR